jgi:hypothetical protein
MPTYAQKPVNGILPLQVGNPPRDMSLPWAVEGRESYPGPLPHGQVRYH